jgi:beta-lactamase regulating signal transducer with metallopeptidase domain
MTTADTAPAPQPRPGVAPGVDDRIKAPADVISIMVLTWLLVVTGHACRLAFGWSTVRGVIRHATPSAEDQEAAAGLAPILGVRRIPGVRISADIDTPQVVGIWRPVVLMPPAAFLGGDERRMALAHELVHARRHDVALGWVPAIAERLFFFHPLARLAAREYLTAREAACDAVVVAALSLPAAEYGRLLVRLGAVRRTPAFAAGGASRSLASLRRRLDMLQHVRAHASRGAWSVVIALGVFTLLPWQLTAQSARERELPAAPARPVTLAPARPVTPERRPVTAAAQAHQDATLQATEVTEQEIRRAERQLEEVLEVQHRSPDDRIVMRLHTDAAADERVREMNAVMLELMERVEAAQRDAARSARDAAEQLRSVDVETLRQQIEAARDTAERARREATPPQHIVAATELQAVRDQLEALRHQLEMLTQQQRELERAIQLLRRGEPAGR